MAATATNVSTMKSGLLREAENEQGAAKIGFFGDAGSGKTVTAALIALSLSKMFHDGAPVAMYDTERGSDFLIPIFKKEGVKLLVAKSRSFVAMMQALREAEKAGCCAFLVDSVTHVWTDIVDSYCQKKNISKPEFHHWKDIKKQWQEWPNAYLNSVLHCLVNGRSGFEYEYQENAETGKKELIKGDSKMRVEGQFGYEPHLLAEMERVRDTNNKHVGGRFLHRAHILKDRSWTLNGRTFDFQDRDSYKAGDFKMVYDKFKTHFEFLNIGSHRAIPDSNSEALFDGNGNSEYYNRERRRKVALEEVEATIVLLWPGQDGKTKQLKINALEMVFGTRSWTAVEQMHVEEIEAGSKVLREYERRSKTAQIDGEPDVMKLLGEVKHISATSGLSKAAHETAAPEPEPAAGINMPPVPKREPEPEDDPELSEVVYRRDGNSLVLSGDTYAIKDQIKKIPGAKFDKASKRWSMPADQLPQLEMACSLKEIQLAEQGLESLLKESMGTQTIS